jgi:hypothetical protein
MNIEAQRSACQTRLSSKDASFNTERPALFSPAAAAQDEANSTGTLRAALWHGEEYAIRHRNHIIVSSMGRAR